LGGGLNSFDKTTQKFTNYKSESGNPNSLINNYVFHIYEDKSGLLWISTHGGIDLLDRNSGNFTHLKADPEREDQTIFPVYEDENNNIWLLDYGMLGVVFYDHKLKIFTHYRNIPDDPNSFKGGHELWEYFVDKTNILWIGTWGGGVGKLDFSNQAFSYFISDKKVYDELKVDIGWNVITEDRFGNYVIGTFGKGIHFFDSRGKSITSFNHNPSNPASIFSDYVSACFVDKDGTLWIGTAQPETDKEPVLSRYNEARKNFEHYHIYNPKIKWWYPIWTIYEDKFGILWLGTQVGLYEFHRESGDFKFYQADSTAPDIHNRIDKIIEDKKGRLWYGTDGLGLIEFDRKTKKSNRYLGTESFVSIVEDSSGKLWLASLASGLILFDPETKQTEYVSRNHGLQNYVSVNLLSDNDNNLWLVTGTTLFRYNPITEVFKSFGKADGLDMEEFYIHLHYKNKTGKMFIGGDKGIITFYPDDIKDNPFPPNVVITNLSLFNRPEEKLVFKDDIAELKEIELAYNQNDLHFEFVALHYSYPANNQYKYKLENFDNDWIEAGTQRNATYTNLDPGAYVFKVIASNCDGIWNEAGTSIKITINPPLWATTWAYLLYIILTLSLIYFLWKLNLRRIRTKHEYEMSRFESEKLHEVDEMKSRFFANISHEFRTPLTLILGPAKDVLEKTKESETKQNVGLIRRNAVRLLGLVNQLLDLSKLEAGRMKLETREENIIPLLKGLVLSFTSLAERKKITLKLNSSEEIINVYLDRDKIEKIINNLLSNAFKFTPDGGTIQVTVEKLTNEVTIKISDSGMGIPKENLDKIFDRFYQVNGSQTREQEGTGIGLALTKELVELHKGKIEVESEEGKGTTFIVRIPLGKDHLKPEEIVEEKTAPLFQTPKEDLERVTEATNRKDRTDFDVLIDTKKPLLLIVEDNIDVRKYIISHLEKNYRIQEAVDGEDGIEQAFEHIPDLIISDVMMPKMDGFKLCEKLKTDERTSHIPIIMLTAKATSQDKISGYETGADDYIMKPFDAAELKVRIKNLIEIRRKLQEKFTKADFVIKRGEIKINRLDEKFIEKLMGIIEKHISEENFTIEEFESEIAMSKSQIYRKLKALTGKSPSRFLRSVRLSKAKKMIQEKQATIAEIAYSTGFGSPAYFTRCFKEEYGHSPSEMK
jgi:signal transduction histidine kinase/DNA-binding response OmpR family regulator/ligand-binding sensor domain-containing protein